MILSNDEVASYSATRQEAETATFSGGIVKGAGDLGNGNWSNSGYLGNMGTKTTLSSPSQISADLSNVNYLSFSYIAASVGVYDLYIRYATDLNCVAYIRANQGPWVSVNLMSTSWWDTPRVAVVSVNMQAGSQTIVLTGTTNDGGWMNYDFIDIIQQGTLTDEEVAINYATFFREQTSAGCTAQNDNLIPWAQLKSEYLTLSASAKDAFVASTNEFALDAKARYQVLINKYSSLANDNWLVDGDGDPVYSSAIISSDLQVNTNAGLLLGVSMIIISTIGLAVILFRKRKFNF